VYRQGGRVGYPHMTKKACFYCGTTKVLDRQIGPEGSWVCIPCVKSDPERELAASPRRWGVLDMEKVVEAAPVTLVDEPLYDQEDDEDNAVVEVDITEVLDNITRSLDGV